MQSLNITKALLNEIGKIQVFEEGDFLLQKNEISNHAFFVNSGCVRMFYIIDDIDYTLEFFFENSIVSSIDSFMNSSPSKYSIQAIEHSEIIKIHKNSLESLKNNIHMQSALIQNLENRIVYYVERTHTILSLTSAERYEYLVKNSPEILARVKQKYIASYIGIKPESLSRIRRLRMRS